MGEFLQRYKLAGTYEQGLTGRGFLATDLNHNRLVVIKLFTCPSTASARRAFALWPQLTHLRHKNLITTLNAFVEENQLYLVYDYAGGNSLDRLLRNKDTTGTLGSGPKTLALEIVTQIARQSLAALDYLHAIGTVHGAIRPENILVGDEVKLADAGLSSITAAIEEQTPEEFQPQTDLHQLGLVLLRATLGRRAEQLTLEETSAGKDNIEFEHRLEQLPEKIRSLLRGLCSPDATQRFTSVSEALASFEDTGRAVITTPKLNLEEWVRQREIKLAQAQVGLNQTTDFNTRSKLYCEIAAALFDKSEFEDALKQCRAGLAELENLPGHEAARKRLLTKETEILTWLGNTEPAQQLVKQALSLNQGDESPEGKLLDGCSKVAAARIYQALGQHELVKNLLDEALPLFQQAGESTGEIDVYLLRAFALIWIENNAEYALQMLKQLQERCCQLQYGWGFLQCMRLISICYSTLENFGITHVLQNFEEMLEYAKALEMRHYIAIAALNLGIMECKNIRLERGLELTEEALEIGAKLGDRRLIAYAQSVVCETLGELGRLQEAVEHGRRGLRFVKEFAEQRSIFEVCDQYTTALWQSGEVEEGERLLLQYLVGLFQQTCRFQVRIGG